MVTREQSGNSDDDDDRQNGAIPQLVLLTKIDEACLEIDEDLSKAYWSRYIYEKVKKLGQILGIPVSCIMPVKNYSSETEPVLEVDILVMKALKQMLNATDDYFSDLKLKGEAH
ncbi:interferon-induced protein 44-like [Polypterus senegalus]|uniref:interferon-induced protein 44-like n=1 Tax=Polypterus senegalus TaxID=55291 RepID=UPI001965DA37|nr:interferon-induced protein 44-like [Polypterus senegalus]